MYVNGIQSGLGSLWYQSAVYAPRHTATTAPVEPIGKAPSVEQGSKAKLYTPAAQFAEPQLPEIREGADAAEMAVRGRIQYLDPEQINELMMQKSSSGVRGTGAAPSAGTAPVEEEVPVAESLPAMEEAASTDAAEETKSPAEVMEEGECVTCKERKYQDGSNDPGVSFKTPTNIAPEQAAAAVRGHEMEHVVREQAKAVREDRQVVQQSVTLHTEICPECGDTYISGGTTRTVTKANPVEEQQAAQNQQSQKNQQGAVLGFNAVA